MIDPEVSGHWSKSPEPNAPSVLVLHPWWGLSEGVRQLCDRLAHNGFQAFAPDLFGGRTARTVEEAEALSSQFDPTDVARTVEIAAQIAAAGSDRAISVVGLSYGVPFALELASRNPNVRAVVMIYGTGAADHRSSSASYQGHFAEMDPYEPSEAVDWVEDQIKNSGRPVEIHRYHGVGHWFMEPDRPEAFDEEASELAWSRMLEFLRAHRSDGRD